MTAVQPHLHVTWFLPSCNDPGHRPNLRLNNGRIEECFSWLGKSKWLTNLVGILEMFRDSIFCNPRLVPNNFEPLPSCPRIIQGPRIKNRAKIRNDLFKVWYEMEYLRKQARKKWDVPSEIQDDSKDHLHCDLWSVLCLHALKKCEMACRFKIIPAVSETKVYIPSPIPTKQKGL